jgi:cystathionine beta-lyase/cystathionine gamma-synthase
VCKRAGVLLAVDNTFMTPFNQRPLALGADIVVHSTTKYLNGHSDVIGGAIVVDTDELRGRLAFLQNAVGAVPSPMDSFLVMRGTKTLHVRMDRHEQNARALAEWLVGAPPGRRRSSTPASTATRSTTLAKKPAARLRRHDLVRAEAAASTSRAGSCRPAGSSPWPSRWAASSRSSSTRRS